MRICLVSQEYPEETDFGGIATYMYYLSNGLALKGHDVVVIARSYTRNSYTAKNSIQVYRIFEKNDTQYKKAVANAIKVINEKYPIDIIESPEWNADLIEYFRLYKSSLRIPVVIKLHTPHFVWNKYNYGLNRADDKSIEQDEKEVICNSDGVFSCSESLKK